MPNPTLIAVLTCHNRRAKTVACLEHFFRSAAQATGVDTFAVLVDDGSRDGTADAVASRFPRVRIIAGTGNLFWNGGMRLGLDAAAEANPEFLLLLNDDTLLSDSAIGRLLSAHEVAPSLESIIVGSVQDPVSDHWTYGGRRRKHWWHPLKMELVIPSETAFVRCETFNGNLVLLPTAVFRRLGNLSPSFTHKMGDYDYGLRANRAGIACLVAPGSYGTCSRNPAPALSARPRSAVADFRDYSSNPKRVPVRERLAYYRAHGGPVRWLFFAIPYLRFFPMRVVRSLWVRLFGSRSRSEADSYEKNPLP